MNQTHLNPEMLTPYDPRHVPQPPPTQDICDGPVYTICVNAFWWSHISGMIERLLYRDAWTGTEDEVHRAIEQVSKILNVGRPTMGCGCGESGLPSRYNSDGDFQVSYDGGTTWVNAPDEDPRNNVTLSPPPVIGEGEDGKCKAANSGVAMFKKQQSDNNKLIQGAASIAEISAQVIAFIIAAGLATITGGAGIVLVGAINAFISGVIASEFESAFDDAFWDKFLCALYCNMGDDLTFDEGQFQAVKGEMLTESNILARTWIDKYLFALGAKGLTNLIRMGALGTLSCDNCDCPGCEMEDWDLWSSRYSNLGTVVERGDDYIEMTSQLAPDFGAQAVGITSSHCCYYDKVELVDGTLPGFVLAWYCGTANTGSANFSGGLNSIPADQQYNTIVFYGGFTPFTIRIYMADHQTHS